MLLSGKRSKRSNSLWRYSGGCFEAAHRFARFRLYRFYQRMLVSSIQVAYRQNVITG